jgi:G:T-mismatch repair DNA endonuclease (very short patch repair protein)
VLLAVTLLGCGTDPDHPPGQPPPSSCAVTHFDGSAADFSLPDVGAASDRAPFPQVADAESVIGMLANGDLSTIAYATLDMDGDHKPDLVITERSAMQGVGSSSWLVYKNTGSGFATTPTEFALPAVGADANRVPFAQLASDESVIGMLGSGDLSVIAYVTSDMDADGKPDLVITERNAVPGVGSSKWLVYKNTGTGFAATPIEYALPAVGADANRVPFAQIANNESILGTHSDGSLIVMAYVTTDMDGDGKPDLVLTTHGDVAGVGVKTWQVFAGSPTGFAATPTAFALPDVGAAADRVPFAQFANAESIIGTHPDGSLAEIAYVTTDMDGDGKPDLVLTTRDGATSVGVHSWQVFAGSQTGFAATPTTFALPDVGAAADRVPFAQFANSESIIGTHPDGSLAEIAYVTTDLDGDRKPDLVLTVRDGLTDVGTKRWQIFHGSETGFAAMPGDFVLPDVGAAADRVPFAQFASSESIIGMLNSSTLSVIAYAPFDLDGDSKPDLVLTTRGAVPGVSAQRWQVFHGACAM